MSKTKSKVVDLERCNDGTYSTKDTLNIKNVKSLKGVVKHKKFIEHGHSDKQKYLLRSDADDFLSGIDLGLDFIDSVMPRIDRFMKLRG